MRRQLTGVERWIAIVRLLAVPFAVLQIAISDGYPPHYRAYAVAAACVLAAGAVAFWLVGSRMVDENPLVGALALAFDVAIVATFVLIYSFEPGTPTRQLLFLPVMEAAVRYGIAGAIGVALLSAPVAATFEHLRADRFGGPFNVDYVTFQVGVEALLGLIVGWLVGGLRQERAIAEARAAEAEWLRDRLGQRVDLLDAANRCARALSSSLELDEASTAFIRELRGLLPFDRMAIVLAEDGVARVLANAGEEAETTMPPGSRLSLDNNLLAEIVEQGQTVYRRDMTEPQYEEERTLLEVGVRCRVVAPLLLGTKAIGILSISRAEPDAFSDAEVELASLLGRLVGGAVQNIRAYETERRTVEELRRLSALRADFVSLVSHDLRSPMATVIGAARTLQQRWRELAPEQRDSFVALIADETSRLSSLISDVLDTSRIDSGSFSYSFRDVDVGMLVRDAAAAASLSQDEVPVEAAVRDPLPDVRADPERLRQALTNLIENAVKWSPHGTPVEVVAEAVNGVLHVDVRDRGPGIPRDQQGLIFEKFGRADVGGPARPGSGLGLYIARSIAEAHGGSLELSSTVGLGSTFTLVLPLTPG